MSESQSIQNALSRGILAGSPAGFGAQTALQAATQLAGSQKMSQGDFLRIYQSMLMSQSFSKIFNDDSKNDGEDGGLGSMGAPSLSELMGTVPGLTPKAPTDIDHVELDGKNGKVVFKDGTTTEVPIQAASKK